MCPIHSVLLLGCALSLVLEGPSVTLHLAIESEVDHIAVYPVLNWDVQSPGRLLNLVMTLTAVLEWGRSHYAPWFIEYITERTQQPQAAVAS
jgi:hypothetical protein